MTRAKLWRAIYIDKADRGGNSVDAGSRRKFTSGSDGDSITGNDKVVPSNQSDTTFWNNQFIIVYPVSPSPLCVCVPVGTCGCMYLYECVCVCVCALVYASVRSRSRVCAVPCLLLSLLSAHPFLSLSPPQFCEKD